MIQEIKRYTDSQGRSVKGYYPMKLDNGIPINPHYEGTVGIQSPRGVIPIDFPFPKEYSLEQCFEKFEETANVEVNKIIEEEKEKSRIVTPGHVNPNNLKVAPGPY